MIEAPYYSSEHSIVYQIKVANVNFCFCSIVTRFTEYI